jgi:L-iditol 2-dehydrogenase
MSKNLMKAGILYAINDIRCEEIDVPEIGDEEILVKVNTAGICGTDFERVLKTGTWRFPTVLGHEFGGLTVKIGKKVEGVRIGDKVVVNPMVPCGKCQYCKVGKYNMCKEYDYLGSRSNGGFAEYAKVKYTNAYKVPDDMTDEAIASIDPVAVALHGVIRGNLKIGDTVAVFGAGPIGDYVIQWAKLMGASKVVAVDLVDKKLEIATEVGADYVINPSKVDDVPKEIKRLINQEGVNFAIESAGAEITVNQCISVAQKQGRVVYLGTPHKNVTFSNSIFESILRKELTVAGSWCYHFAPPIHEWLVSIENIYNGHIKIDPVITHRFSVQDIKAAFDMIRERKEHFNKILIKMEEK